MSYPQVGKYDAYNTSTGGKAQATAPPPSYNPNYHGSNSSDIPVAIALDSNTQEYNDLLDKRAESGKELLINHYCSSSSGTAKPTAPPPAYNPNAAQSAGINWDDGNDVPSALAADSDVPLAVSAQVQQPPPQIQPINLSLPVSRDMFVMYDRVLQELRNLEHVERDIAQTNNEISGEENQLANHKRGMAKLKGDMDYLNKRIYRNENPRFLHYLQFDREGKVKRLKGEMEDMVKRETAGNAKIVQETQNLVKLRAKRDYLLGSQQRKHQLIQGQTDMFNRAVASAPATPFLLQIKQNQSLQSIELGKERNLEAQVANTLRLIQQSLAQFQEAENCLRQAASTNRAAAGVNLVGAMDRRPGFDGPEFAEMMIQRQRDELINRARPAANNGSMIFAQAVASFPMEARMRHPIESSQIGQVPLPQLKGANFGNTVMAGLLFGDVGDAINDMRAAQKIRDNMQVISQCVAVVASQARLIETLYNVIRTNCGIMESQMQKLSQQEQEEKTNIFNQVRRRYGM